MLSLLLIASDPKNADIYISDLCAKEHIDPIDMTIISTDTSIGIEDVRELLKKIFLKPIKSKQKLVIIKNAETATREAQNALLKILEEPPDNTRIILNAATKETMLPTVLSRCAIRILDTQKNTDLSEDAHGKQSALLERLQQASVGERLTIAQDLSKNKEEAIAYISGLLHASRTDMLTHYSKAERVNILQEVYKLATTTNVNLRLLLEHMLLSV